MAPRQCCPFFPKGAVLMILAKIIQGARNQTRSAALTL
jgi:hypothetical protein